MRTRISEIDLLRFLAALAVMLMHYLIRGFALNDPLSPMHFPSIGPYTRYNYLGVDLFFIISGFMILMSTNKKDNQLISPKEFILSRFLRLYPAYWFCCTASFLMIYILFNDIFHVTLARYFLNMSMFNGFFSVGYIDGVYWTLCLELKFYIFILVLLYINHISVISRYLIVWTLISGINFWLGNTVLKYIFITDYAPFFISGCLFYLSYKQGFIWWRNVLIGINFILGFLYENNLLAWKTTHYVSLNFYPLTLFLILASFFLSFLMILNLKKWVSDFCD